MSNARAPFGYPYHKVGSTVQTLLRELVDSHGISERRVNRRLQKALASHVLDEDLLWEKYLNPALDEVARMLDLDGELR